MDLHPKFGIVNEYKVKMIKFRIGNAEELEFKKKPVKKCKHTIDNPPGKVNVIADAVSRESNYCFEKLDLNWKDLEEAQVENWKFQEIGFKSVNKA